MGKRRTPLAVILGGAGSMGRLLSDFLQKRSMSVICVDRKAKPAGLRCTTYLRCDATCSDGRICKAVGMADIVIVSLPFAEGLRALGYLSSLLAVRDLLVVDTISVKGPIVSLVHRILSDVEYVSINPLFSPKLGFQGRKVAVVDVCVRRKAKEFKRLLRSSGAILVSVSPEEHDDETAISQVMVHALLLAAGALMADRPNGRKGARLTTPVATALYSLIARVASGNPAVYADIQRYHPHANKIRNCLVRHLKAIGENNIYSPMFSCKDAFGILKKKLVSISENIVKNVS